MFEDGDRLKEIERSQSPGRVQLVSEGEGMSQLIRTSLEREIRISCICNGKAGNAMFGLKLEGWLVPDVLTNTDRPGSNCPRQW